MKTLSLIGACLALMTVQAFGQVSGGVSRSVVTNILKTNASILMMSPAGGNNQILDMQSSIPAFDGQFGESYAAGGGRNTAYLWASQGTGTGTNAWGLAIDLPGGSTAIGDQLNMPLLSLGTPITGDSRNLNIYFNGNPAAMNKSFVYDGTNQADQGVYIQNMNPFSSGGFIIVQMVDTNFSALGLLAANAVATNTDGIKIYKSQFGIQLDAIPSSDPIGETNLAGSYDLIVNGQYPFFMCGNYAYNGGPIAQRSFFVWDPSGLTNSTKFAGVRIPRWVANAFHPTNAAYLDAFTVNVFTGDVNVMSNFFAFRGKFTNDLEIGIRSGEDFGHGLDCNTNASFNATSLGIGTLGAAWTFDALASHRVGFLSQATQFPKLAHGQGTPFTFTRANSTSDLLSSSAAYAVTDEVVIDASGNLILTNGGTLVLSGNINLPKTVSSTTGAQTVNKISGSVIFAAAAQSIVVTDSLVDTNSIIIATVYDDDTTAKSCIAKGAAGSFTLKLNAAATAQCRVNFLVTN